MNAYSLCNRDHVRHTVFMKAATLPLLAAKEFRASRLFRDYQAAFENVTGLPLAIQAPEEPNLRLLERPNHNPFCSLMMKRNAACAACATNQFHGEAPASLAPQTYRCFAGLWQSAVSVCVEGRLVASLRTGPVLLHQPEAEQFSEIAQQLIKWGFEADLKKAETAWLASTVLTPTRYDAVLRLLEIFAQHLSLCASALCAQTVSSEPEAVTKARRLIQDKCALPISVREIARAVNVSAGYFSELFHKATGLTFTDYVARVRVEKVKHLLENPHLQITTIAFENGFQSLSQFNRVFKQLTGVTPRVYRSRLKMAA